MQASSEGCNFGAGRAYPHAWQPASRAPMSDDAPPGGDAPVLDIDASLARRAAAGDDTAFEVLVVKHQRRVAALIRRSVRDERIVEELVQEVFLKVHGGLPGFRPDGPFTAWLSAIARNVCASYLRSAQNRQDDRPVEPAPPDPGDGETWHAVAASPEEEAMARQLFSAIDDALAALPDLQRRALLMREADGLPYADIAQALSLPLNTVKSHIHRARESIARGIGPLLAPSRGQRW